MATNLNQNNAALLTEKPDTVPVIDVAYTGGGTTAQRPPSPVQWFHYYNTELGKDEIWDGSNWIQTTGGAQGPQGPQGAAGSNGTANDLLVVNSGTGAGSYPPNSIINISPADVSRFRSWSLVSGGGTFGNANSPNTTFTLSAGNATIVANEYSPNFSVQSFEGRASLRGSGGTDQVYLGAIVSGSGTFNARITITSLSGSWISLFVTVVKTDGSTQNLSYGGGSTQVIDITGMNASGTLFVNFYFIPVGGSTTQLQVGNGLLEIVSGSAAFINVSCRANTSSVNGVSVVPHNMANPTYISSASVADGSGFVDPSGYEISGAGQTPNENPWGPIITNGTQSFFTRSLSSSRSETIITVGP